MNEKDLAKHLREVADAPDVPDPWLALARDLARAERPTPELGADLLAPFLTAWRGAPEARELERFFQVLTFLVPAPPDDPVPAWLSPQGAWPDDPRRVPYHRESGLPLVAKRLGIPGSLVLLPGGPVSLGEPQLGWQTFEVRTGYVAHEVTRAFQGEVEGVPGVAVNASLLEHGLRLVGYPAPSPPTRTDVPLALSRLFGRRGAHGLTPEDREPLPPPIGGIGPEVVAPPRLSGAAPMRLGGAVPEPVGGPRRGLIQWLKDLFDQ